VIAPSLCKLQEGLVKLITSNRVKARHPVPPPPPHAGSVELRTNIFSVSVEVHPPTVTLYVTTCKPGPAATGSNAPVAASVIPGPLHVPPAVAAFSVVAVPFAQKGPTGVIDGSAEGLTVMSIVSVSLHPPMVML